MNMLQKMLIKKFFAATILGVGLICFSGGIDRAQAVTFSTGDVFVSVSDGQVQHYDSSLNLVETLVTGQGGYTTGMGFDSTGNLYVTNFSTSNITKFDNNGALVASNFVTNDASSNNESIVFDNSGNFFVGQAGGTKDVIKRAADGTFLARYNVDSSRGSDWVDLAADQTTIFYTTESGQVKRYDTITDTQLADFASIGGVSFALRLLSDGGVLVANSSSIKRLDSTGAVIQTYDVAGEDSWFALNLDGDGTSFWSGDYGTANFYKFDINTGAVLASKNTGTGGSTVFGLAVFGELTQGCPDCGGHTAVPEPSTLLLLGSGLAGLGFWRMRKNNKV